MFQNYLPTGYNYESNFCCRFYFYSDNARKKEKVRQMWSAVPEAGIKGRDK